ncbi:hypothetical protein K8S19_09320 [bacterium]|nr:hypothetical protein [bacterium]
MNLPEKFTENEITQLEALVQSNVGLDFAALPLTGRALPKTIDKNSCTLKQGRLVELLKAYQRLVRVLPEPNRDLAIPMLRLGLHSALQIAAMKEKEFCTLVEPITSEDPAIAPRIHKKALLKRSRMVVQYMDVMQNNEPHVKAARV